MIEANTPAFPFTADAERDSEIHSGFTKREYIAIQAMNSIASSWMHGGIFPSEVIAKQSVEIADALIVELNKATL